MTSSFFCVTLYLNKEKVREEKKENVGEGGRERKEYRTAFTTIL
jgi:hypothetical protein